ncbi:histidine phosphatase family protein (plasmid) [Streptomyces viridifaciens]|nr:histidine phosphatase family protein [Streptomyces viridifaciens]
MMELLVIRHAHDLHERSGDRRLSPAGRSQAIALAKSLADAGVTELWSSTSTRAVQTASEIASTIRLQLRTDPRLDEIRTARPDDPDVPPPRERAAGRTFAYGTEDWTAFLTRVSAFVSELLPARHAHHRAAAVTHSGVFDAIHEALTGAGRRIELEVAHTGVSVWRHRPGSPAGAWLLRCHNDTGHLATGLLSDGTACNGRKLP